MPQNNIKLEIKSIILKDQPKRIEIDFSGSLNVEDIPIFSHTIRELSLKYGGTEVAVNIVSVKIILEWTDSEFTNPDSTHYPNTGLNQLPFKYSVVFK